MKIGFTCSAFDLFHAGHVDMLRVCKEHCDHLIVGLHCDPSQERTSKNKPVQSIFERYILLRGSKYVDEIIPYQTEKDLYNLLASQKIDVRFLGEEYVNCNVTGQQLCIDNGIKLIYIKRRHDFSSSELRERIKNG